MEENSLNQNSEIYDYIFCGTGAATSLVLLQMHRAGLLQHARVLLIDKSLTPNSDKTFCFWDEKDSPMQQDLQHIISHAWDRVSLPNKSSASLAPLQYNHIFGKDLQNAVNSISLQYHWHSLIGSVGTIERTDKHFQVQVNGEIFLGSHVFDSRTPNFAEPLANQTHILQSFVGWKIKTKNTFNPAHGFRMMDFNVPQDGHTQFVYILPYSEDSMLVELTRFGSEYIQTTDAADTLHNYILRELGEYTKMDEEHGCIPMCNSAIADESEPGVIQLGARNYSIKPSTGYAFKTMYEQALQVVASLQSGEDPSVHNKSHQNVHSNRFSFYDSLLLDILHKNPNVGRNIFEALFRANTPASILNFLDEKTTIRDEVKIFSTLPLYPFLQALYKHTVHHTLFRPILLLITTVLTVFAIGKNLPVETIITGSLVAGLLLVGIPHGAVDHLVHSGHLFQKKNFLFITKYLLRIAAMAALWFIYAPLALLVFILYSAWHFGETDGIHWKLNRGTSFLWGTSVILYIIGTHATESNSILASMSGLDWPFYCPSSAILIWTLYFIAQKRHGAVITTVWLLIASQLPLLYAFGFYFIGQHSISGWLHLKSHLKTSHRNIWIQSLPFHAGAWLLYAAFYQVYWSTETTYSQSSIGLFFIFLACLSLPHVFSMHSMYKRQTTV
jgi:lycopene beta-cyclase